MDENDAANVIKRNNSSFN